MSQKTNDESNMEFDLADAAKDGSSSISRPIFEEIVWSFPDVIHSVDKDGTIISTNKRASELLGYEYDELIGMSVYKLYPKSIAKKVKDGFSKLKQVGIIEGIQSQLVTKSGEIIDVEIRSLSIYKGDEFIKTFSIIRDLREIKTLKNQLQEQSKLASIGELAAGIIHDIRNPLSIITSYNHFIKSAIEKKDEALLGKIHEKIGKAAQHIARLTSHLQQFVRQEKQQIEEVAVIDIVENSLLMVENRVKTVGALLVNNITDKELKIHTRPDKIEQVIINLISNAADALGEHGKNPKNITLEIENHSDHVIFKVIDNGPGIPADVLAQIFQAFFTTKARGKGTGLGLSICKGIVQEEQGTLEVESELGKGTTFSLKLPKMPRDETDTETNPSSN